MRSKFFSERNSDSTRTRRDLGVAPLFTPIGALDGRQIDVARCHTARSVAAYLDSKKVEYIKSWPAHSPDLNPIESFWAYLDRHLTEHYPPPMNAAELKDQIRKAWDEIPQAKINAFVLGFGDRVKACLRRKGA